MPPITRPTNNVTVMTGILDSPYLIGYAKPKKPMTAPSKIGSKYKNDDLNCL
jgi:hypothetical protein